MLGEEISVDISFIMMKLIINFISVKGDNLTVVPVFLIHNSGHHHGCDRMVVIVTTTCPISAYYR